MTYFLKILYFPGNHLNSSIKKKLRKTNLQYNETTTPKTFRLINKFIYSFVELLII